MDVREIIKWLLSAQMPQKRRTSSTSTSRLFATLTVAIALLVVASGVEAEASNSSALRRVNETSTSGTGSDLDPVTRVVESARSFVGELMGSKTAYEVGRTFGRPLKRLQAAMLPIMFKLGVISTLIFFTFLLALKSVKIGMLLLIFKIFGIFLKLKSELSGGHHGGGWSPHKDIHLHVMATPHHHPSYHGPESYYSSGGGDWHRYFNVAPQMSPYYGGHGQGPSSLHHQGLTPSPSSSYPSSINTPYGHYVRTGDPTAPASV